MNLPEERFWRQTWRTFDALSKLWRRDLLRWAIERADYRNAHIDPEKTEPYLAADFMPGGDREARIEAIKTAKLRAAIANMQLSAAVAADDIDDSDLVPAWAKGPYHGDR